MRFELTTVSLATRGSTTELHSHPWWRNLMGKCPVGKRFLVFEVVNYHTFAVWLEHFLNKLYVQWMFLIGVLCGLVIKDEVEANLIGLINHITMAACHSATVIMQYPRAGFEEFFRASKQGLGGAGLVRFRPENNYMGEHGRTIWEAKLWGNLFDKWGLPSRGVSL